MAEVDVIFKHFQGSSTYKEFYKGSTISDETFKGFIKDYLQKNTHPSGKLPGWKDPKTKQPAPVTSIKTDKDINAIWFSGLIGALKKAHPANKPVGQAQGPGKEKSISTATVSPVNKLVNAGKKLGDDKSFDEVKIFNALKAYKGVQYGKMITKAQTITNDPKTAKFLVKGVLQSYSDKAKYHGHESGNSNSAINKEEDEAQNAALAYVKSELQKLS